MKIAFIMFKKLKRAAVPNPSVGPVECWDPLSVELGKFASVLEPLVAIETVPQAVEQPLAARSAGSTL